MCKIMSAKRLKEMIEARSAEKELNSSTVCPVASQRDGRQTFFIFFKKYFFQNNFTNITSNEAILSVFKSCDLCTR